MKKILKTFLAIIVIVLNFNVAKAIECEDIKLTAPDGWGNNKLVTMYDSENKMHNYWVYKVEDDDNLAFSIYCRNPGLPAGINTGSALVCTDKVLNDDSTNETDKMFDAGVLEILKKGYSTRNPKYSASTDPQQNAIEYVATNLALRVYEILGPVNSNSEKSNGYETYYLHVYYANRWKNDPDVLELLMMDYNDSPYAKLPSTTKNVKKITDAAGNDITKAVEDRARELLIDGLSKALYYKRNGAASIKGTDKKPVKSTQVTENKTYKTILTYTFEADKFKSENADIKIKFNCPDCSKYGVNYGVYVNNSKTPLNHNDNLVKFLKNGSGELKVNIIFSTNSKYNCESFDYSLELRWFDDSIDVEAYNVKSSSNKSNLGVQEFYMLYAIDEYTTKTIKNSVELCSMTCNDLEIACNQSKDPNSTACKLFKEKYNGNCAQCTTKIDNPKCTKDPSNINILEGYEVDSECNSSKENIKQCVIDNEDPAGNKYKVDNIGNEYCTVYCKEDYHFTLPGIEEANSGRYFSLSATVKGTKTCYTSEIDKDKFDSDLDAARKKVVVAWNDWSKWNSAYNSINNIKTETVNYSNRCTSGSYLNYSLTWGYKTYDENGYPKMSNTETLRVTGSDNCNCNCYLVPSEKNEKIKVTKCDGTCNPTNANKDNLINDIKNSLNYVKGVLDKEINAYLSILNKYNSCSGINSVRYNSDLTPVNVDGWKMKYNYNPTIKFWYEESYMNNVRKDNLDTVKKELSNNTIQEICSSDVSDSYKCSTAALSSLNKNNTKRQFVCKQTGSSYECGWQDIIVSTAKYVKQSITVNANYITPTQFYTIYPTGAIVVSENGTNIENATALENSLPIGLGTRQGVYNYALKVENLGEYYNKNELGRIWGNSNSVVVNVLNDLNNPCVKEGALTSSATNLNSNLKDGVYVCAYKVNCPNCPVECDPTCKWDGCPNNNCPVECDKCVYTNNSTNIGYRPISPGDINPNDRDMGKNWKWDESIDSALELKAYVTTQEIEENGETIYDVNYEDVSADQEFAMQIDLDTKLINLIKAYNDQHKDDGGYANNTLKCYDHVGNDGITYNNIYCYSSFLDEMIEKTGGPKASENGGSDNFKIIGGTRFFEEADRKSKSQEFGIWTTWSEASNNKWITSTSIGFNYNEKYKIDVDVNNKYEGLGVGPSWK